MRLELSKLKTHMYIYIYLRIVLHVYYIYLRIGSLRDDGMVDAQIHPCTDPKLKIYTCKCAENGLTI